MRHPRIYRAHASKQMCYSYADAEIDTQDTQSGPAQPPPIPDLLKVQIVTPTRFQGEKN